MIPSYDEYNNRCVRVFISSTFKDMQNEREILVNGVFPRLRKQFKSRMVEIIDVDLRWGVPADITDNSTIIEICLGEVLRCKPFFLGMIGSRYGYVPKPDDLVSLSPDISSLVGELHGISITEMEIRAGINVASKSSMSFHIRDSDDFDDDSRLSSLKTKLESYGCQHYTSYVEFEKQVYLSLYASIDSIYPEVPTFPYGDNYYFSHLSILKTNNESFIQDEEVIEEILSIILKNKAVYVYGIKGIGKTALMSRLIYKIGQELDHDVFFSLLW